MRIGLHGSIANNMYCLAKILRAQGYDAEYIEHPADRYPMSQPIWEDVEATLALEAVDQMKEDPLQEVMRRSGWESPDWVVPPVLARYNLAFWVRLALRIRRCPVSRKELWRFITHQRELISRMSSYDWLIVCGIGVVPAFCSGVPYLYWPHGGDIRILPFQAATAYDRFFAAMLRVAISHATVKGTHDPTMVECFRKAGIQDAVAFLPFIVDVERYAPRPEAGHGLLSDEILERAKGKRILLLSARQDFYWKGTDRFIRAFVRAVRDGAPLFLIVSRWGNDVKKTEAMLREGGVEHHVWYLEHVVSKPLLVRFYNLADVVVDQFAISAYGTTMLEAMACAKPVMIYLDEANFLRAWPEFRMPPVINVSDETGVYDALKEIGKGSIDLDEMGRHARAWIVEHHGPGRLGKYVPATC
jgi:glycosyltransferase involved in cell wall biosynthesis